MTASGFCDPPCVLATPDKRLLNEGENNMKMKVAAAIALVLATAPAAFAYTTTKADGSGCVTDGSACLVRCASGVLAGTMYWNGTRWSDGVRSNADMDIVAKEIVAAQGTACK